MGTYMSIWNGAVLLPEKAKGIPMKVWLRSILGGLSLFVLACEDNGTQVVPEVMVKAGANAYLALGDSYTIGEGVSESERWPMQLASGLRAQGLQVSDPQIIARTGWTTGDLAGAMDEARPKGPFALVTLLIGVNNQFRGYPREDYRMEFRSLLARAIVLADGKPDRVAVLSIPDWGASFYAEGSDRLAIGADIDAFNAINLEETRAQGARYVDVTGESRAAIGKREMFAADGLHPSAKMYGEWVGLALTELSRPGV